MKQRSYMKKLIFMFLMSIVALCSCEKGLVDDGLGFAIKMDEVPETGIKASQLGSKKYTEAEFQEFVDGYCYERVALYRFYRKKGDDYYLIESEESYGKYVLNTLERSGASRDIRLFENGELTLWLGTPGNECKHLYKYAFNATKQHLAFGGSRDYVAYIDDEYLITQGQATGEAASGIPATSAHVVRTRTVYRRTEVENWHEGNVRDYRNVDFGEF